MAYRGYSEADLVANRASLLIHGGSANDRRAWAEEAARSFEAEGPLREVHHGAELLPTLSQTRGVVFIPDVGMLSDEDQARITRTLLEHEERPKFVIGLSEPADQAMASGKLRMDLGYRLSQAIVDLSPGELKETIKARRAQAAELAAKVAARAAKLAPKLAPKAGGKLASKSAPKKAGKPSKPVKASRPAARSASRPMKKASPKQASRGGPAKKKAPGKKR